MGKKVVSILLGGFVFFAAIDSALAMGGEMSMPNGWYLEGNVGSGQVHGTDYPGKKSNSGIGGNLNVGYKFMAYIASEIGYTMYPNTGIKNSVGTKAGSIRTYSYDLAIRGILPFSTTGFETFAKLGVNRISSSASIKNDKAASSIGLSSGSHSTAGLYIGAGAQYYFVPEFAANIQWQRANGGSHSGKGELISVGGSYIFS